MRLLKTTFLLAVILFAGSCYNEDFSFCPEEDYNVLLAFTLVDEQGKDIFEKNISSVDVVVYDQEGAFVLTHRVGSVELDEFKGAKLNLDPGTYYVACWGNVEENTTIEEIGEEASGEPYITYNNINNGKAGDGDKVFYATKSEAEVRTIAPPENCITLEVDEQDTLKDTVSFHHAHRILSINIVGFKDSKGENLPLVELTDVPYGLSCFGMSVLRDSEGNIITIDAEKPTDPYTRDGEEYASVEFNTFYFDLDSPIIINIIDPTTGNTVYSKPLAEVLDELNINTANISIAIEFVFRDGDINIILPGWNTEEPGWSK